jgi:hypothetical protein
MPYAEAAAIEIIEKLRNCLIEDVMALKIIHRGEACGTQGK